MACKGSIIIFLTIITFGNLNCQESKNQDIVQILNNKGIEARHANKLPVWGKYTYDPRSLNKRGFLLYDDGSIYNYSTSTELPHEEWKNWGKIDNESIDKIKNILTEMDKTIDSSSPLKALDNRSVMVQYHFGNTSNLAIIPKSYDSSSGKILQSINNVVNEAIAARSKN
jgi:hypothetical protein